MHRPLWQRILLSAWVRPVLLVIVLLVLWDLAIRVFRIPPYLIPRRGRSSSSSSPNGRRCWREAVPTTYATLGGFALSIAVRHPDGAA